MVCVSAPGSRADRRVVRHEHFEGEGILYPKRGPGVTPSNTRSANSIC